MNGIVKLGFAAVLAMASCCISATDEHRYRIGGYDSGSWFNPDQSGHGFKIEVVSPEKLVIYWYAYHPDGTPMWLISEAAIDGDTATGDALYFSGMRFGVFDPAPLTRQRWGSLSVRFLDCFNARLSYASDLSHGGVPFGSGEIDLERLSSLKGQQCPTYLESGLYGNYTATLGPGGAADAVDASYITIQKNGDLAYRAVSGDFEELGFGRIVTNAPDSYEFDVIVETPVEDARDILGQRRGVVTLEEGRVTLDLGQTGVLEGFVKSSTAMPLSAEDLVGRFFEEGGIDGYIYEVFPDGSVIGRERSYPDQFCLQLTVPDPGINQVVLEEQWECESYDGRSPMSRGGILAIGEYSSGDGVLHLIESRFGSRVAVMKWYRDDPYLAD